ncbi:GlsB/YeaQ/YmgE family stress response membrane protein [Gilliamella sp. Pas-s25]|uniref:GlsB/YeaQ/YmgE family stress response membrane protein n=1 Tax=Gilliamella sp. Pas-s25 TaxID=2687310 RepID=UPI00135ECF7D|nr:GlsB/YeaQ/YmgE family stress response membrane protein [Gilliamella sp. Pas-s25]MWP60829.1 GlsB/YeaQ/YmgE family stress response membrane protein [Gilliamella sp. Pas-s25]
MDNISWIIALGLISGLIAGFIAKFFMPLGHIGIIKTTLLGLAGTVIGGCISPIFGWGSVTGFNFPSILISVIGTIILIYLYRI